MKIAQVAPLAESVPPKLYGGTERIVAYLSEQLVAEGHDVTVFASADSTVDAEVVPCSAKALRLSHNVKDYLPFHVLMLEKVRKLAHTFDVIHFHVELLHFPLFRDLKTKIVTTLHGRLDMPGFAELYEEFWDMPLVSISHSQRWPMPPNVNWVGNVYHGLPRTLLPFQPNPRGNYLAFLGRISPEKGPDRAIEIAARAGLPLKIAAKIDAADEAFWRSVVRPLIEQHPNVEFIGEIGEAQKADFLGNALALLFPIDWPEPFGLVMIEAMACGTPIIAFKSGSVPEIVESGRNGLIVSSVPEAVEAVKLVGGLDRALVRKTFETRFSADRMAKDYSSIYAALADDTLTIPMERSPGLAVMA